MLQEMLALEVYPEVVFRGSRGERIFVDFQCVVFFTLFPGLAITVTVLAYYLVGEGIRDALDPRLHR